MHKITIQFITLVVAVAIGFAAGFYWSSRNAPTDNHKEENKALKLEVMLLREGLKIRGKQIEYQDSLARVDSVQIVKILDRIKQSDAALKQERDRVNKLPTNEKVIWLYNYYGIKP